MAPHAADSGMNVLSKHVMSFSLHWAAASMVNSLPSAHVIQVG
jgi:hypothetical protein